MKNCSHERKKSLLVISLVVKRLIVKKKLIKSLLVGVIVFCGLIVVFRCFIILLNCVMVNQIQFHCELSVVVVVVVFDFFLFNYIVVFFCFSLCVFFLSVTLLRRGCQARRAVPFEKYELFAVEHTHF